jgi:hypothetical protein
MKNILLFGSCRIFEPFKLIETKNDITNNWYKYIRYVHSTKDIIQFIKIIKNELKIDDEILEHIYTKDLLINKDKLLKEMEKCELYVIEISTIKEHLYKNYYINRDINNIIFENIDKNAKLISYKNTKIVDKNTHNFCKNVFKNQQTSDELINDMIQISELLKKPIIFVSHIRVDKNALKVMSESLFKAREFLSINVKKGAEITGNKYVDPTDMIDSIEESLESDLSHYKHSMIINMSKKFNELI